MKLLSSLILLLFFAACNDNTKIILVQLPPESSKIVQVKLIDSLGNVTISIPTRYDTSFTWTDQSDCGKPCDKIKYRWQPKALPITKEFGWIWKGEPMDSIERFTISHSGYFPFHDNTDSSLIFHWHQHKKSDTAYNRDMNNILTDTVEKIGDRYFSIIAVSFYDTTTSEYCKKVLAATTIKCNIVDFYYELLTKKNNSLTKNFIANCKYFLKRIRISNGK